MILKFAQNIMRYKCSLQVADDPETLRIKQNTKNISNVAYHGDIQKKAAMERQREMTEIVDNRGKSYVSSLNGDQFYILRYLDIQPFKLLFV